MSVSLTLKIFEKKLPKTIENHIIKMGWDIMNGLEFFLQCNNKNQLTCF